MRRTAGVALVLVALAGVTGIAYWRLAGPENEQDDRPAGEAANPVTVEFTLESPAGNAPAVACPAHGQGPLVPTRPPDLPPVADASPIPAGPLAIALWGDSHMAGSGFVATLADALRQSGRAVLQTEVALGGMQSGPPLSFRAFCFRSTDWKPRLANLSAPPTSAGGGFGASLATLTSLRPGAQFEMDLRGSEGEVNYAELMIDYVADAGPLELALRVNGMDLPLLEPQTGVGLRRLRLGGPERPTTVTFKVVSGTLSVHAIHLRPIAEDAIVFNPLGLKSAALAAFARADADALADALPAGGMRAVLLAYGTNDAAGPDFSDAVYREQLRAQLTRLRSLFPDAACTLIGAPDRDQGIARTVKSNAGGSDAKADEDSEGSRVEEEEASPAPVRGPPSGPGVGERHRRLNAVQAEVAPEFGCRAWNWQAAMGGVGSARRWHSAPLPLMLGDLTHMAWPGSVKSARQFLADLGGCWRGACPVPP